MSRIFISHSSLDNAKAAALGDWLRAEGWGDLFLDFDAAGGISAGERWMVRLSDEADRCEAVVFLLSPAWRASDWCLRELQLAIKLNKRLFGVLIEDLPPEELPPELRDSWQLVDLVAGSDHQMLRGRMPDGDGDYRVTFSRAGLLRLRQGLTKAGLDPRFFAWPPPDDPERPPWRGMRPLEFEDAGIFFGRDAAIIAGLDQIRGIAGAAGARSLVVLGASGSGKSSFLRAGLLPRLARDDLSYLPLPMIRPERAPLSGETGLVPAIAAACGNLGLGATRAEIASSAEAGPEALAGVLHRLASAAPGTADAPRAPLLVVAVDQAEELFRADAGAEAEQLLGLLTGLMARDDPGILVLFAIRTDAYEPLQTALAEAGLRPELFDLPPVLAGAFGTIIEGPAKLLSDAGRKLAIEPALTARLLSDLSGAGGSDALPLLSFTLEKLYLDYGGDGDLLLSEYEDFGGIRGAIDAAVRRAFERADGDPRVPREQQTRMALVRRALIPWLAGIDPETNAPRRNVARLSEIPAECAAMVEHLVDARLLLTGGDIAAGTRTIEVAHESLLRQWGTLNGWLEEDLGNLIVLETVKRAARDWLANERRPDWLVHQAGRLEDAEGLRRRDDLWAKLDGDDRDYLLACRRAEDAERERALEEQRKLAAAQRSAAQRLRAGLAAALVLSAIAAAFGWYGFDRADEAVRQATIAEQAQEDAEREARNASAARDEAEREAAVARQREEEAESARLDAESAQQRAEAASAEAETQRNLAEVAREQAERAAAQAEAESRRAEEERRTALDGIAKLTRPLLLEGRADLAMANVASVAADVGEEPRPLTPQLEAVVRRAFDELELPLEKSLTGNVYALAVSPDSRWLAAGTAGNEEQSGWVHVFELPDMRESARFRAHGDPIMNLSFSPNGEGLLATGDGFASLWEIEAGRKVFDLEHPDLRGYSKQAQFTPNGARIVVGTTENRAYVHDADTGELLHVLAGSEFSEMMERAEANAGNLGYFSAGLSEFSWAVWGTASDIALSPDGKTVAVSGGGNPDGSVRLFDVETGQLRHILSGGEPTPGLADIPGQHSVLAFTPDGRRVISAAAGETIKVWNAAGATMMNEFPAVGTTSLHLTRDSKALISAQGDGSLIFQCLEGIFERAIVKAHEKAVYSLSIDHEAGLIATTSADGFVKLWRLPGTDEICPSQEEFPSKTQLADLLPLRSFRGPRGAILTSALLPGGDSVVTGSQDARLNIFPTEPTDRISFQFETSEIKRESLRERTRYLASGNERVVFSVEGSTLFVKSASSSFSAWSTANGLPLDLKAGINDIAPKAAGGETLLFATPDLHWKLSEPEPSEAETAEAVVADHETSRGSTFRNWSVAPDGRRLLMGELSGQPGHFVSRQYLYDIATSRRFAELSVADYDVGDTFFTSDSSHIVGLVSEETEGYGSDRQAVAIWDAETGKLRLSSRFLPGHSNSDIVASADGRVLLWSRLGGSQEAILLVPSASGRVLVDSRLPAPEGDSQVTAQQLASDGTYAVLGFSDGTLTRIALDDTRSVQRFETDGEPIIAVRVSPDGSLLAAADDAGAVWIFSQADGARLYRDTFDGSLLDLRFDPVSKHLVVCEAEGDCTFISLQPKTRWSSPRKTFHMRKIDEQRRSLEFQRLDWQERDRLSAFSGDGRLFFFRSEDSASFSAWDIRTGRPVEETGEIHGIAPTARNGETLLFATPTVAAGLSEMDSLSRDDSFGIWQGEVTPSGERAIYKLSDFGIRFRDPETGAEPGFYLWDSIAKQPLALLQVEGHKTERTSFSPDGSRIFGLLSKESEEDTDRAYAIAFWDPADGKLLGRFDRAEGLDRDTVVQSSSQGSRILLSNHGSGPTLAILAFHDEELGNGWYYLRPPLGGSALSASALTSDGRSVLAGFGDGSLVSIDTADGRPNYIEAGQSAVSLLRISPDDSLAAAADTAGRVWLIDLQNKAVVHSETFRAETVDIRFDPKGEHAVVCELSYRCHVLDIRRLLGGSLATRDMVDWFRAVRPGNVTESERYRYGTAPLRSGRPDLDLIEPLPVPEPRGNPPPNEEAAECDRLAANPTDRDRRVGGVAFEEIEIERALAVCTRALKLAPDDPQTSFQLGRVQEVSGDLEKAFESYLTLADIGYAAALRGLLRLTEEDEAGRFDGYGSVDDWMAGAVAAGDPWGLVWHARDVAIGDGSQAGTQAALTLVRTAGVDSMAEASVIVAEQLALSHNSPEARERILFFSLLGREIDDTLAEPALALSERRRRSNLDRIRGLVRTMDTAAIAEIYRDARSWQAQ